jgi:hypothetical protein
MQCMALSRSTTMQRLTGSSATATPGGRRPIKSVQKSV